MWELLPPAVPRKLKLLCVLKVLGKFKQHAEFQHRTSMHHADMRICICTSTHKSFFHGFEDDDGKIMCSNRQKALPYT